MNAPGKSLLIPFLAALVLSPALLLAHELAHYGAALWVRGTDVKCHYSCVTWNLSGEDLTRRRGLVASAGPLVQASLAVGGFLWLCHVRKRGPDGAATLGGWIATLLALNAGRWLRGFTGLPSHPQPRDEAVVSQTLGFPGWFLPYLLAPLAVIAIVALVRLHRPGHRLYPFLSLGLGVTISGVFWMTWVGPFVLP